MMLEVCRAFDVVPGLHSRRAPSVEDGLIDLRLHTHFVAHGTGTVTSTSSIKTWTRAAVSILSGRQEAR